MEMVLRVLLLRENGGGEHRIAIANDRIIAGGKQFLRKIRHYAHRLQWMVCRVTFH